jgi:hypothetical protein
MKGFRVGDRVIATDDAYTSGVFPEKARPVRGVFTGFSLLTRGQRIAHPLVRREDQKISRSYHPDFWRRADGEQLPLSGRRDA